jgi:tetratricopeptide (TPR) repeat protein
MKKMKRIIISVLALGVCLTPLTMLLMVRPSWAQSQDSRVEEIKQLLEKAQQQTQQGQHQQAIESFQKVLTIARQFEALEIQALALLGIGKNYEKIKQYQSALDYLKQALDIFRSIKKPAVAGAPLAGF